jgi:hypothetical protein
MELPTTPSTPSKSSAYAMSISHLNLRHKTYNALVRVGVSTVADLLRAVDSGITNIWSLGSKSKNDVEQSLTAFLASIDQGNTVNWSTYCRLRNIEMLPKEQGDGPLLENIIIRFPQIVKEILCHNSDDTRWRIIQRWFGLESTEKLTLDLLSTAFGVSATKIQNLRNSALTEIREALIEDQYVGKLYRIRPEIVSSLNHFFGTLSSQARDFFLETELLEVIRQNLNFVITKNESSLFLLLNLAGMKRLTFGDSNLSPIWEYTETGQRDLLEAISKICSE